MIDDEQEARRKFLRRMVLISVAANFLGPVIAHYFPTPASIITVYWFVTLFTAAVFAVGYLRSKPDIGMYH